MHAVSPLTRTSQFGAPVIVRWSLRGANLTPTTAIAAGLPASALRQADRAAALARVDSSFGPSTEWNSPLIAYRLAAEFQSDWKEEVGHWLESAERCGYLDSLLRRVLIRAKRRTESTGIDANDPLHNVLLQELAPAMATHYLVGTGWTFCGWEPVTGGKVDVDVSLKAPDGRLAYLQVKSSDQPGVVVAGRRVDGEYDARVLTGMVKAARQLPSVGPEVKLIALSANRVWPLSRNAESVAGHVFGGTVQRESGVTLPKGRRGAFWTPEWNHVAGVILLDYVRGIDAEYSCTVLLNTLPPARACSRTPLCAGWTVQSFGGREGNLDERTHFQTEPVSNSKRFSPDLLRAHGTTCATSDQVA